MFSLTANSEFKITVPGEKLRQLLTLKIHRIEGGIEREKSFHEAALAAEKAQRDAEEQMRGIRHQHQAQRDAEEQMRGIRHQHQAQLTAMHAGFAPVGLGAAIRDPDTHARNIRVLQASLSEIRWLHDILVPSHDYVLNRGDLALFGNFSIPGEEFPQLVGAGQCLA